MKRHLCKFGPTLPMPRAIHYVYGGGMLGCLYDYGPNYASTKKEAIDQLVWLYDHDDDLADGEETEMREQLAKVGFYRFKRPTKVGAHYCEVQEVDGPCPEES